MLPVHAAGGGARQNEGVLPVHAAGGGARQNEGVLPVHAAGGGARQNEGVLPVHAAGGGARQNEGVLPVHAAGGGAGGVLALLDPGDWLCTASCNIIWCLYFEVWSHCLEDGQWLATSCFLG